MSLDEKIGPLSTAVSHGASHFCKGMGSLLNKDLPPEVREVYANCAFFNRVGSVSEKVLACDFNHLGKRT